MGEFLVGGKRYTDSEIMSMSTEEFSEFRRQWLREQEERDSKVAPTIEDVAEEVAAHTGVSKEEAVAAMQSAINAYATTPLSLPSSLAPIPPPEPETPHRVRFTFWLEVLGNDATILREVQKVQVQVERILARSLHKRVSVSTEHWTDKLVVPDGWMPLSEREADRIEGQTFEGSGPVSGIGAMEEFGPEDMESVPDGMVSCGRGARVPISHVFFPDPGAPWHRHVHGVEGVVSAAPGDPTYNSNVSHCLMISVAPGPDRFDVV